jgi:hypothetical protein
VAHFIRVFDYLEKEETTPRSEVCPLAPPFGKKEKLEMEQGQEKRKREDGAGSFSIASETGAGINLKKVRFCSYGHTL